MNAVAFLVGVVVGCLVYLWGYHNGFRASDQTRADRLLRYVEDLKHEDPPGDA